MLINENLHPAYVHLWEDFEKYKSTIAACVIEALGGRSFTYHGGDITRITADATGLIRVNIRHPFTAEVKDPEERETARKYVEYSLNSEEGQGWNIRHNISIVFGIPKSEFTVKVKVLKR